MVEVSREVLEVTLPGRLLMLWGPWLAGLYLACVPVQLATALALVSQGQGKDERVR